MDAGSSLLLDECFDSEDSRFIEELRKIRQPKKLAGLAERWKKDGRPWAREQIFAYLDRPLDVPGHQPLVKRLFKHAEQTADDDLMAAFLAAFDRLVRRVRKTRHRYDYESRSSWEEEILKTPRDTIPGKGAAKVRNPRTGQEAEAPAYVRFGSKLFSYRTRYYLRRRAWRHFRRLGFRNPDGYPLAIARALARYRDEELQKGENILDSWGLVKACFGEHDALSFTASRTDLKEGRGLGELTPAPRFIEAWQKPAGAGVLLGLLTEARSRLVRVWGMQLLKREHAARLKACAVETIARLLEHEDAEVQQFGADLLAGAEGLDRLPVSEWLKLLSTRNPQALQAVCDAMSRHVTAERLDLPQCLELALARPAPIARMGFQFLKSRPIEKDEEVRSLGALADAKCSAIGKELAAFALVLLGAPGRYDPERVSRFFDSLAREVRAGALDWLGSGSVGFDDPGLWGRLLETPFDDVRLRLVDLLEKRAFLPGESARDLAPVWLAVLLGIHRGGRQKLKALRQVSRAVADNPARAEGLLPALAVAIRSVRPPEARAGLSAVVSAVTARPELLASVERLLPELKF